MRLPGEYLITTWIVQKMLRTINIDYANFLKKCPNFFLFQKCANTYKWALHCCWCILIPVCLWMCQFWRFSVLFLDTEDRGMLIFVSYCSLYVDWTNADTLITAKLSLESKWSWQNSLKKVNFTKDTDFFYCFDCLPSIGSETWNSRSLSWF